MSTATKATKKSAFSCEPCRRRKVKCGGEQPACGRCASRNDECVYKLNPSLSYTQRLENRIRELEEHVATLSKSPISTYPSSAQSSPSPFSSHHGPPQTRLLAEAHSALKPIDGLKLDENGCLTYHGATSFFHLPSEGNLSQNEVLPLTEGLDERRARLVSNAWQQRALEDLSEIPEPFRHLLNVHWCWVQPLFSFVYRPAFTRDMQVMGPYYTHTLLNAVLSHSLRWGIDDPATKKLLDERYESGMIFTKHARCLVFDEIGQGACTVPTIQTLLLLSAQECGMGNATQAWMYSGLAFRLLDHLGICVDNEKYVGAEHLSEEDVEIRHRLYWSCYFWDKMISLYLGRSPTIQYTAVSPPHALFDDSAENDMWTPFGLSADTAFGKYPPSTAHSASCFTKTCELSVIFNQILVNMYDPLSQSAEEEIEDCVNTQKMALQRWWDELPSFLRLDPNGLPPIAPPSHIVTMNCLYHTLRILLYRPMLTGGPKANFDPAVVEDCLVQCVTSSISIIAIFNLFVQTFSAKFCVLSLSYSIYIASTIFLLQVQAFPGNQYAIHRLGFCIRMLNEIQKSNPMLTGALELMDKKLAAIGLSLHFQGSPSATSQMNSPEAAAAFHSRSEGFFHSLNGGEGPDSFSVVHPELGNFDKMASLEPLSAWVGAIP